MQTTHTLHRALRKPGGFSALYLAAAYVLAMPYFLLIVSYPEVTDAAEKVALLSANLGSMRVMYLITYIVFGLVLGVLVLSLREWLVDRTPVLARLATAAGLLWAVMLVASGLVFVSGMSAAVALHATAPDQAIALWQAVEPVSQGLGGAQGELLGGVWMALLGAAVVRGKALSRPLGWFGLAIGVIGLASVVPALAEVGMLFGVLQIVWFVWLGVALLRNGEREPATQPSGARQPVAAV